MMNMRRKNGFGPEINGNVQNCSSLGVNILLVDNDSVCLTIVSEMLRAYGFIVTTARLGTDALCILNNKEDEIEMVLTELHFPDMDTFKLLEAIREMSSLPVVVFSNDNSEDVMQDCLSKGAALYIPKPITIYDIRTLWQLSVTKKKSLPPNNYLVESVQESSNNKRKQWSSEDEESGVYGTDASQQQQRQQPVSKRSKIVWTPELHRKFQHAVHKLGIDRACPKKILQHMNVPELNRKNISSHLQKYRVFYKETVEERKKEILQDYTTVLPDLNPLEKIHATSPFRYYNQGPVSGQPGINPSWTTLGLDSDSPGNYLQQPRRHLSELGKLLLKVFERFLLSDDYTTPWPGVVAILRAYLTK